MLGVCYYPEHWPEAWWARDAARMASIGIRYVRIGEFAWSRLEPEPGAYDWGWLDRAMDTLAAAGLEIVLGTPTATPPKWLMDQHPDIQPYDEKGRPRGFGSRRHYSFSSQTYWRESARIVEAMARRYGAHKGLAGWQTDNEFGCHFTVLSWGAEDLKGFQAWLRQKYQTTDQLNAAWGNVFWSMELRSFEDVCLPALAVTEVNPSARLDFWRYASSQVAAYNRMQADIIRRHSPDRFVSHNFMGFFNEFDHWDVGDDLDVAAWDSYPIGFGEQFLPTEAEKARWAETSHPDVAAFHHDLYRAVGHGRLWVMEQQPGPVNWAPWNPVPKRGMVRLWTWEAFAHGAEVVSYFRWRQAHFAQEQMHAGLNLPHTEEWSPGGFEAKQCGEEIARLGTLPETRQASVAIIYDYEAHWITTIQPQAKGYKYHEQVFRWYEAVRRGGLDVDFVRPGASLAGYRLVLAPTLPHVSEAAARTFEEAGGVVLLGARTGSKTRDFSLPENLPPGPLAELTGARVVEVSSMRPSLTVEVSGTVSGRAVLWAEHVEASGDVLARFASGAPAFVKQGRAYYLACVPDEVLLMGVMKHVCAEAGLTRMELPEHVRLRRRGGLIFAFNYGPGVFALETGKAYVLGTAKLGPYDVAAWRE